MADTAKPAPIFFDTAQWSAVGFWPGDISEEEKAEVEAELAQARQEAQGEDWLADAPELLGLEGFEDFGPEAVGFPALSAEEEAREIEFFSAPRHDDLPF